MNKTTKKILLGVITLILIITVIAGINFGPMLFMKPVETGEISDSGIYAVKNKNNNLFLIKTDSGYIAVDAGSDLKTVESTMKQMGINTTEIQYVLLTHSDSDHLAALELFQNAQVFMCDDEMQMIDGSTKRNIFGGNNLPDNVKPDALNLLTDGQQLTLGEHSVLCVKAPGHTPGSMVYVLDGKYLFTGDAFKVSGNQMSTHPYTMDDKEATETIEMLKTLKSDSYLIFTAHYGYYLSKDLQ